MIVSEKHKVIFVAIPKTATRSIYNSLINNFDGKQLNDHQKIIPIKYQSYYSFTVIRNPYDRAVSIWWSTCKRNNDKRKYISKYLKDDNTFLNFCKNLDKIDGIENRVVTNKQINWINNNNINKFIKFENLNNEWNNLPFNTINNKLDILNPTVIQTDKNPNARKSYKNYLNSESIKLINDYYHLDFKLLKYNQI
jgi:hypothetical protein